MINELFAGRVRLIVFRFSIFLIFILDLISIKLSYSVIVQRVFF